MGLFAGLVAAAPAIGAIGNLASTIGGYFAQNNQSKLERAWQEYNNTMARLTGAMNQNVITNNEVLASQALATQGIQLQQQETLTASKGEVSAAAAGVAGRSVDQTIMNIHANAANVERQREIQLNGVYLNADQAQINNDLSVIGHQDNSFIAKPSLGTTLLGAGLQNLKQFPSIFTGYDPKGSNATPLSSTYTYPAPIPVQESQLTALR